MKTRKQIAEWAGISQAYLCFILQGKRTGTAKVLKRLAIITGTPIEWWIDHNIEEIEKALLDLE